MKILGTTLCSFLAILHLVCAAPTWCVNVGSQDFHQQVLDNYIGVWDGNYDLADQLLDPAVVVYSDRLPSPTGSGSVQGDITSRDQYVSFIEKSRSGWQEYSFEVLRWTSDGNNLSLIWQMHGIIGENFTLFPTPLKAGATVSYNGSDFLHMDNCTGLVVEDHLTQDLITLFHALELGEVSV